MPRAFLGDAIVALLMVGVVFFGSVGIATAQVSSNQAILQNFLKPGIVKIQAKFSISIRDGDNKEICDSEGTGFIVDRTHVVTATHVFDFNPACGQATIFAKSPYHENEWHLVAVDREEDVALLQTDPGVDLSKSTKMRIRPCAMSVSGDNVYDVVGQAIRYGIPAGLSSPTPVWGDIGSREGQFTPLVQITPTPINFGESGGPVVTGGLVVGIMRSRVVNTEMIGLMTPAVQVATLLTRNQVKFAAGAECSILQFIEGQSQQLPTGLGGVSGHAAFSKELLEGRPLSAEARDVVRDTIENVVSGVVGPGRVVFSDTEKGVNFQVNLPAAEQGAEVEGVINRDFSKKLESNFNKLWLPNP
ncbi:serine protease [Mesorhizobium sp.]|uniref:S1 family peptidase n=1 Tax=Mesorhizobium sp. TaxID=1871066 RepID=UPI0012061FA8|nr:serine protease [Mesorhizobium sp.]TIN79745.1 MAG: trypsin-like peptidase domain-containing protein [Mesorhizobium sp.]